MSRPIGGGPEGSAIEDLLIETRVNFAVQSDRLLIESAEAVTICADAFNPN